MQVNLNTNHQTPQFGMAFIRPKTIEDTRALAGIYWCKLKSLRKRT